jgi:hypothetical protein
VLVKGGGPARTAVVFTPPLLGLLEGVHHARTAVVFSPPRVWLLGWHLEVGSSEDSGGDHAASAGLLPWFAKREDGGGVPAASHCATLVVLGGGFQ